MNWLVWVIQAIAIVPHVVMSIEAIHGAAKSGADKKTLALEALGLAADTAQKALPEHRPAINAASALLSNAIDNTVSLMNAVDGEATGVVPVVAPSVHVAMQTIAQAK